MEATTAILLLGEFIEKHQLHKRHGSGNPSSVGFICREYEGQKEEDPV